MRQYNSPINTSNTWHATLFSVHVPFCCPVQMCLTHSKAESNLGACPPSHPNSCFPRSSDFRVAPLYCSLQGKRVDLVALNWGFRIFQTFIPGVWKSLKILSCYSQSVLHFISFTANSRLHKNNHAEGRAGRAKHFFYFLVMDVFLHRSNKLSRSTGDSSCSQSGFCFI